MLTRLGRDSPSSYKLLASSVRVLRNVLEDVDELVEECSALSSHDTTVGARVASSRDVLGQLDLALQRHRCLIRVYPSENAIEDLRTAIEVSAHQLSVALRDLKEASETEPDVSIANCLQPHMPSTRALVSSATGCDLKRRISHSPSASLQIDPAIAKTSSAINPTGSIPAADNVHHMSEKEGYDYTVSRCDPEEDKIVRMIETVPNWRLPFATIDPLSCQIREASTIIMDTRFATETQSDEACLQDDAQPEQILPESAVPTAPKRICCNGDLVSEKLTPNLDRPPSGDWENLLTWCTRTPDQPSLPDVEHEVLVSSTSIQGRAGQLMLHAQAVKEKEHQPCPISSFTYIPMPPTRAPPPPPTRAAPPPPIPPRPRPRAKSRYVIANPVVEDRGTKSPSELKDTQFRRRPGGTCTPDVPTNSWWSWRR